MQSSVLACSLRESGWISSSTYNNLKRSAGIPQRREWRCSLADIDRSGIRSREHPYSILHSNGTNGERRLKLSIFILRLAIVQVGFIPLMLYGLVMWITRSRKYAGKITIWQTNVSSILLFALTYAVSHHSLLSSQIALRSDEAVETVLPHSPTDFVKGESEFVESVSVREKEKF